MLTNNPIISNFNQGGIFLVIFPHSDEKIWFKCSHEDFISVWNSLTCWLLKDVVRWRWIVSGVAKLYTVVNFGNLFCMTISFFLKMFSIWWRIHKWNKKLIESFLYLRELDLNREQQILTIWNRILVVGSPCVNKQPYHLKLQSGRHLPSHFSSQWRKNMVKVLSWRFTSVWNRLTCWLSKDVLRRRWIVSGVTKPYTVANFGNTLAMTIFFFLKMFKIWWRFHQWNKKLRKCFLFLTQQDLNGERQILKIRNRILVIGIPCVNKQPYDFKLQSRRYFPNNDSSQWWKNMVKVLWWRFC